MRTSSGLYYEVRTTSQGTVEVILPTYKMDGVALTVKELAELYHEAAKAQQHPLVAL